MGHLKIKNEVNQLRQSLREIHTGASSNKMPEKWSDVIKLNIAKTPTPISYENIKVVTPNSDIWAKEKGIDCYLKRQISQQF